MDIRHIINKPTDLITKQDIADLMGFIKKELSPWPWNPKHILKITKAGDLEFSAKSPEMVNKLCEYIFHLYSIIEVLQEE